MSNPITISRFTGMNNILIKEGVFSDKGVCTPRITLNADCTARGRLIKRSGCSKVLPLATAHSLWSCRLAMLCVSNGKLFRIIQGQAVEICSISGPQADLSYSEYNSKIYISNLHWNAVFDPFDNSVSDWGLSLPEQPVLTICAGSLPAGTYQVCLTRVSGYEISGNGAIASIEITEDGRGIGILNRNSGDIVWATDPNGSNFYLVGHVDTIMAAPPTSEPLPSFLCSPAPFMENITHAFGRAWGFIGKTLYYSEPMHPEWFRLQFNRFDFNQNITLIAQVPTGMFVGCENNTYFLKGVEPEQMSMDLAGSGAIPGTLFYCNNVPELGDVLSPAERIHVSVPIWLSQEGIVIGNISGRLFNLTQQKVKFAPGVKGAALHRIKNGEFQFLTSFKQGSPGSGFGMADAATAEVFRNGKVI